MLNLPKQQQRMVMMGVGVIVLIAALVVLLSVRNTVPKVVLPPSGAITITGKVLCLPHKDEEGPQTLECAYGLQDTRGRYFALRDSDPNYTNISKLETDTSFTIEGTFTPEESTVYKSIGVIEIKSVSD